MIELEKIRAGDLRDPIRIRAKDHLQKVANEFEEMRVELKGRIAEMQSSWDSIKTGVIDQGSHGGEIDKNIEKLGSELSKFKI